MIRFVRHTLDDQQICKVCLKVLCCSPDILQCNVKSDHPEALGMSKACDIFFAVFRYRIHPPTPPDAKQGGPSLAYEATCRCAMSFFKEPPCIFRLENEL